MNFKGHNMLSLKKNQGDWLGIDVGTSTIKVVCVSKVRGEWSLQLRRLIPVLDGEKIDCNSLSAGVLESLIQDHLSAITDQKQKVSCVVSSSIMELQTVELPAAQPAEVRQMLAVEFEAREDGLSREFDFFENEKTNAQNAETNHWSVLSIPSKAATGLAESLRKVGVQCERLNSLPCVLAQAVQLGHKHPSTKPVFALDWGANTPSLTLIANGRSIYSRNLRNCGLHQFLLAGCERFECQPSQFCEMLNWVALDQNNDSSKIQLDKTKESLKELSNGVLDHLSQEVERTLAYVKQEYPENVPETMWLFGGGAMIPDICSELQEKTELKAKLWQLPVLRNETQSHIDPLQAMFGTAIVLSVLGRTP